MVIAIDLIDKMLEIDPDNRITCDAAISHPFVKFYNDPDDEPVGEPFIENNEEMNRLTVDEWKRIYLN